MKKSIPIYMLLAFLFLQCSDDNVEPENEPNSPSISADFSASETEVYVGQEINFTDISTGSPTSWNWVFEGGSPGRSGEQNPTVTYDSPGTYPVKMTVSNDSSEDVVVMEDFINVMDIASFVLDQEVTYGVSTRSDFMQSMIVLEDNSIVCTGWTEDEINPERINILVTKFDKDLNLVWDVVIGGSKSDLVRDIISTKDGGFLLSATTKSNDGDIPVNNGEQDITIVKLTGSGSIDWIKVFGGSAYDGVNNHSLIEKDNGYAFVSSVQSVDAEISGKVGLSDIWLSEIDLNGNITHSIVIGSTESDHAFSFVETSMGYAILSKIGAASNDFDQPGIWLFNVNLNGDVVWKTYIEGRNAGKLIKTKDGGYATLNTNSENYSDLFVTKFDNQGGVQWERTYPLPDQEFAEDIIQVNNGYLILGNSEPLTNIPRNGNAYVAKLNESGDVIQSKVIGNEKVSPATILETGDGRYIIGGTKNITDSCCNFEFWLQSIRDSD